MSGEPSPMANSERSSAKKARVESPSELSQVKSELADQVGGRGALVAVNGAAARAEVAVRIDKDLLHCPICTLPLKPPIFQCGVGHLACGSCHGQLPTSQCHSCDGGGGGAYSRCPAMDAFVSKALVPCPHEAYGCRSAVAYHQAGDHGSACPHAPCACAADPACAFVGSPRMLLGHLAAAPHSWPVDRLRYGEALRLRVPESESRRLLVADEEEEDGGGGPRVFVVSLGDRGARAVPVTVACIRAASAAAAGPHFTCKMWVTGRAAPATGKVESVLVDMEVPSTAAAGAAAAAEDAGATFLAVPRKMLRGESKQMLLSVRMDRVSDHAAIARSSPANRQGTRVMVRRMEGDFAF